MQKILIIQPGRIGDIIFSLPLLVELKKLFSESKIEWVVENSYREILEENPYIYRIIPLKFKEKGFIKVFAEVLKLKRYFSKQRYDISIDLHGLAKSAIIVLLAAAKFKIASASTRGMKEFSYFFSKEIKPKEDATHCVERHLEVIKFLGAKPNKPSFPLLVSKDSEQKIEKKLQFYNIKKKEYIVIHPGGSWRSRRWFPCRYKELIHLLLENFSHYKIILIGKDNKFVKESNIVATIKKGIIEEELIDFSNFLSLKELIFLIKNAKLFMGNEAGPLHIAAALETPYVAIIGPTDPKRTGPYGAKYSIIKKEKVDCQPCRKRNCKKLICLENISAKEVFEHAKKYLN